MLTRWIFLALLPAALHGQNARDSVTIISVSAARTMRLAPDRATFVVSVEGVAETAREAVSRGDAKLRGVLDALRALGPGVELDRPQTLAVLPSSAGRGIPSAPGTASFTARSAFRVRVRRLELLAGALVATLDAGATASAGIAFESAASDSVRLTQIADALAASRRDAEAIAAGLGGRLGVLLDVNTSGDRGGLQLSSNLGYDGYSPPGAAPELVQSVVVTMRFRFSR